MELEITGMWKILNFSIEGETQIMELGIDNTLKNIIIFPDGEIGISNVGKYQIEGKNIIGTVYDDEDEDEEICFCYKIEELSCKNLVISDEEGNSLNFEKYSQEL